MLFGVLGGMISGDAWAQSTKGPERDWRGALTEMTQAARGGIGDLFRKRNSSFVGAKDKLAVLDCGVRTGSGFLLQMGERTYLVTNAHVVRDTPRPTAMMMNGRALKLGPREMAVGRDLARFEVSGAYPTFTLERDVPDIGDAITVMGNSDGRGVVTELHGKILGVGPQELEVDAGFVLGNSGSPVLNRAGRVVGVATYLKDCRNAADWTKSATRFNGVRRFALRFTGLRWVRRP